MRALTLAFVLTVVSSTVCGQGRARRPRPPPLQPQPPPARPPPWMTLEMVVGQEEGIDATGIRSYSETGGIAEVRLAPTAAPPSAGCAIPHPEQLARHALMLLHQP